MSYSSLLQLYSPILVSVCTEWLVDVDLCFLDAAICSKSHRERFLNCLRLCLITNTQISQKRNSFKYDWFDLRSMRLRTIYLGSSLSHVDEKLISDAKCLDHVTAEYGPALLKLLDICPIILNLRIEGTIKNEDFLSIIPKLTEIRGLDLERSACLTDKINSAIVESMPHLTYFRAPSPYSYRSYFGSEYNVAEIVRGCKKLTFIEGGYCPDFMHALVEAKCIQTLSFHHGMKAAGIDGSDMRVLVKTCPQLDNISVRRLQCYNFALEDPEVCLRITTLHLCLKGIDDKMLHKVATACVNLTLFSLSGESDITDSGVMSLVHCRQLTHLTVENCQCITDESVLALLKGCHKLTYLDVSTNWIVSDESLKKAFTLCPTLTSLKGQGTELSHFHLLDTVMNMQYIVLREDGITMSLNRRCSPELEISWSHSLSYQTARMFQQCPTLVDFSLYYMNHAKDDCIRDLVKVCPLLTAISLTVSELTCETLRIITAAKIDLRKLVLIGFKDLTDDAVVCLVSAKKNLRKLWFKQCEGFGDAAVTSICFNCKLLESIDLRGAKVSSAGVCQLLHKLSKLRYLDISYCHNVGKITLATVVHLRKRMTFLSVNECLCIRKEDVTEFLASGGNDLVVTFQHKSFW